MISFKEYLIEKLDVLNPKDSSYKVLRQVYKTWDKERYKQLFDDFKSWGFVDKRSTRLYFPLGKERIIAPPNNDVVRFIKEKGYDIINYTAGILQKSDSKGKLVTASVQSIMSKYKQKELYAAYLKDPHHIDLKANESSVSEYMIVISRHPYDIIGMSTGRAWSSCMNLDDGAYRDIVPIDVKEGSLVAYMVKATDKDIQEPIGRLTIRPYYTMNKHEVVFGVSSRGYYDKKVDLKTRGLFENRVVEWVDAVHKKQKLNGIFVLKMGLYDSESESYIHVGDVPEEHISVLKDASKIKRIKNPPLSLQMMVVGKDPFSIRFIDDPFEEVQYFAVDSNRDVIEYIEKPTKKVQMLAVKTDGLLLRHIKKPFDEVIEAAVRQDGYAISHLRNPSPKVQKIAINDRPDAIEYIENPTEEVQLLSVTDFGDNIRYIDKPSEQVQIAAVEKSGWVLRLIVEKGITPSEEVQELAILNDADAIRYIENPSEEIQMIAVKEDYGTIDWIKNPTEKVAKFAQEEMDKSNSWLHKRKQIR